MLGLCMPGLAKAQEEAQKATSRQVQTRVRKRTSEISEEDRATMALDSTATQWSFQFALQVMPGYHEDILPNGETRKPGNTDFAQLRIVAPIPMKGFTILPRVTIRHYENAQGPSGIGNTEIFGLIIPQELGLGQWAIWNRPPGDPAR